MSKKRKRNGIFSAAFIMRPWEIHRENRAAKEATKQAEAQSATDIARFEMEARKAEAAAAVEAEKAKRFTSIDDMSNQGLSSMYSGYQGSILQQPIDQIYQGNMVAAPGERTVTAFNEKPDFLKQYGLIGLGLAALVGLFVMLKPKRKKNRYVYS